MVKHLLRAEWFISRQIPRFSDYSIVEHVDSGTNGHLFRAVNDLTGGTLAYKVVPVANLPENGTDQQVHLNEARIANEMEHDSVVKCIDVVPWRHTELPHACVVFVCNYIDGPNLNRYVKANRSAITVDFVERFLEVMFEILHELKARNRQHGDLHPGNILVSTPRFEIHPRPRFWVTDFGVRALTVRDTDHNDYLALAHILKFLLEAVDYVKSMGRDRYAFGVLRDEVCARHLLETDPSADELAFNPPALLAKLETIDERYAELQSPTQGTLSSPFDYPNCEQIGNSHLLLKSLYSNRLLGLSEIQRRSNLVITGPRGCGKTTVFRALSLIYRVSTDDDRPRDVSFVGIYYRCDDLYFAFPRYRTPARQEGWDIPIHFLTVTLLALALEQVTEWGQRHYPKEMARSEERLVRDLWAMFAWKPPNDPTAMRTSSIVRRLRRERERAANRQRRVHIEAEPICGYFGPDRLFVACELIRKRLSFLRERHFYFLIDDYSDPKITKDLQANLNRVLMHRSADAFFKLSTESPISFAREDLDGKQFVESREYDLLNLGLEYISSSQVQTAEFLDDLFSRRFGEVPNYPVQTLEELLGSITRNENEFARTMRNRGGRAIYAGKEAVAAMCSGDVHYMIRLVGHMVKDNGGRDSLVGSGRPRIPTQRQDKSIRSAAGAFMESVRTLPRHGPKLARIVSALGNVAHSYLLYRDSKNEEGTAPHQASRIEPYEPVELSDEGQGLLEELLRYSILIADPRGKSRRGQIVPRFYLRRYLIPHVQLTFSRRDSLPVSNLDLELLLRRPDAFEERRRIKSAGDRRAGSAEIGGQPGLFTGGQSE